MRILVTGGTGLIGRALCAQLLRDRHELSVLSRSSERIRRCFDGAVAPVTALDSLHAAQPFDAVVNLAGEPIFGRRWSVARKSVLRDSRVGVTEQLAAFIDRAAVKPEVLLSGSAIGFYGDQGDRVLDESSSTCDTFSHRLCAEWEDSAARIGNGGTRVCTLRTGLVLSRSGGMLQRMLPPFKLGLGGRLGNGRQWMSWIHIDDHVRAMTTLLNTESLSGAFNLTSPDPATNARFTATLAHLLHRPAIFHLPATLLRWLFGEMAELLLASQRVIPRRLDGLGFQFLYPTLESALTDVLRKG